MSEEKTRIHDPQNQSARPTGSRPPTQPSHRTAPAPRRKRGSGGKRAADIVVSVALVAVVAVVGVRFHQSFEPISQESLTLSTTTAEEESTEEATEETTAAIVYENIAVDNTQIHAGDLILVNGNYAYTEMGADEIVSIYEYKTENEVTTYHVSGSETSLRTSAIEAFSEMMNDFYVATGHDDIIILSGYRTTEEQQALYDADLESTGQDYSDLVAEPGHSEHETGYALDVSIFNDNGEIEDYDGTGDYEWINENCDHYGYILRYTEDKADLTGIQSEEWHYRYVGQPHATYIMDNDLCLEEYVTQLKSYDSENPLEIVNWDGEIYDVYYVAADTSADMTYVLVPPSLNYTISGNNVDGFIITVDTGEIAAYESTSDTDDNSESVDETGDSEETDDISETETAEDAE